MCAHPMRYCQVCIYIHTPATHAILYSSRIQSSASQHWITAKFCSPHYTALINSLLYHQCAGSIRIVPDSLAWLAKFDVYTYVCAYNFLIIMRFAAVYTGSCVYVYVCLWGRQYVNYTRIPKGVCTDLSAELVHLLATTVVVCGQLTSLAVLPNSSWRSHPMVSCTTCSG